MHERLSRQLANHLLLDMDVSKFYRLTEALGNLLGYHFINVSAHGYNCKYAALRWCFQSLSNN